MGLDEKFYALFEALPYEIQKKIYQMVLGLYFHEHKRMILDKVMPEFFINRPLHLRNSWYGVCGWINDYRYRLRLIPERLSVTCIGDFQYNILMDAIYDFQQNINLFFSWAIRYEPDEDGERVRTIIFFPP